MISAQIIEDSINAANDSRLTTFIVKFPRFLLPEFNTHSIIKKLGASSRAIPLNKQLERLSQELYVPKFGKNQAGMQSFEWLNEKDNKLAQEIWIEAKNSAVEFVKRLQELNIHKQWVSRLIEVFSYQTMLCTATEWENFFALRAHEAASPEFGELAYKMLYEYNKNIPIIRYPISKRMIWPYEGFSAEEFVNLNPNLDWHRPFSLKMPEGITKYEELKISIARGARISYLSFDGEMDAKKDFAIFDKLLNSDPKHCSPAEMCAFPIEENEFVGPFKGWFQFRKLLPNENAKDPRVIKRKVVNGVVC